MRKRITLLIAALMVALSMTASGVAFAGDFGAGGSTAKPHDANAKCHPPGKTAGTPGC